MHQKFLFFNAGHFSRTSVENHFHSLSTSDFGPFPSSSSLLESGSPELTSPTSSFAKFGVIVGELDKSRALLRLTEGDEDGDGEAEVLRTALFSVSWCRVHMLYY